MNFMQNLICILIGTSTAGLHIETDQTFEFKKRQSSTLFLLQNLDCFGFVDQDQRGRFDWPVLKRKLHALLVCEVYILIVAILMFQ